MSLAPEIVSYVFQAFPNASIVLEEMVSKYARELTTTVAFGLVALWEFIYNRLSERDPETIHITAASENIAEALTPSRRPDFHRMNTAPPTKTYLRDSG